MRYQPPKVHHVMPVEHEPLPAARTGVWPAVPPADTPQAQLDRVRNTAAQERDVARIVREANRRR